MLAIFSWVWSHKSWLPYAAILLLAGGLKIERAMLASSRAETQTTKTALQTAEAANQSDTQAIAELQAGLTSLQKQLGQEQKDAAAAAAKASQASRELSQRLAAAQSTLQSLVEANTADENFLNTDLNTLYPDIAKWLRDADALSPN